MKTIMLASALVLGMTISTQAQKIYVQGGVNLANISSTNSGATEENNMLVTFNAGILGRFGISPVFDLETGLLLDGRGAEAATYFTDAEDDNYIKASFNPFYLELPLHAVFKLPLSGEDNNLFFFAGPYAAMGIFGKTKVETSFLGVEDTYSEDIEFTNDNPLTTDEQEGADYGEIKRFDIGVNAGAGMDFGSFLLKVKYAWGLTKINAMQQDNNENDDNKYRTWSIAVGIPLTK